MSSRLLSLAVTVNQHDCGDYYWQILESHDHLAEFELLVEGARPHATYIDALRGGCEALAALCEDPLVGPVQEENDDLSSLDEPWWPGGDTRSH